MVASQLLLGLYLVATLAVFAAAYDSSSNLNEFNFNKVVASSCGGTKGALLNARDGCCNELGNDGQQCIGVCSAAKEVFDSVTFLHLCKNYDACSAGWNDVATTGRKQAAGGCSLDAAVKQCGKVVKVLNEHKNCFLALLKESSGDDNSFKEALVKLGLEDFHGMIVEKLLQLGN